MSGVDQQVYFEALIALGYESFSVEPDGTVWTGTEDEREYVDKKKVAKAVAEVEQARQAVLDGAFAKLSALGLTTNEIAALLGR